MSTYSRAALAGACLVGLLAPAVALADAGEPADEPLPPGAVARLGSVRLRHACVALAWAPDGKAFASVGTNGSVRVWDAATGKTAGEFKTPNVYFSSIAFAPDGKRLAAGATNGTTCVLDAATGREVRTISQFGLGVAALAWRADDDQVVTLTMGGGPRIWDMTTGKSVSPTETLAGRTPFSREILSPDGRRIALWRQPDLPTVSDADGKELCHAPTQFRQVDGLAFSSDGKTLAASSLPAAQVAFWDVDSGKEARRLNDVHVLDRALTLSPDGKVFAGRGTGGAVHVWDAASGKDVRQFDVPPGMLIASLNTGGTPLAFSPDGKFLAGQGLALHLWDLDANTELAGFVGHNAAVEDVRFSADGRTVLTCGRDGAVGRWDAATGKRLAWRTRSEGGDFIPVAAPDGKAVLFGQAGAVYRWDVDAGRPAERAFAAGPQAFGFALAPALSADGKTVALLGADRMIHIWDVDTGKEREKVRNDSPLNPALMLSPDGSLLAVGVPNGTTRLIDVATSQDLRTLEPTPSPVVAGPGVPALPAGARGPTPLGFAPDGRTIAALFGSELVLWEVATGRDRIHVARPGAVVQRAAFSPDGGLVAVGASNGTVALLDAMDGWSLAEWLGHAGAVTSLAFSPDGKALASGGAVGIALVWDVKDYSSRKRPTAELPADRLPGLWKDLQDGDAGRAYKAVLALAVSPKSAMPYLRERLTAVPGPEEGRIAQRIKDLDDDSFDVREAAQRELEKLGPAAIPAVRQALGANPSPEARRRLQELLARQKEEAVVSEQVRALRALEALERSGAPEAADALRALAKDADKEIVKKEAAAALDRLERRTGGK